MKKLSYHKYVLLCYLPVMLLCSQRANAQADTAAPVPVVKLQYFSQLNNVQYLLLQSSLKKGKILTPQFGKSFEIFLDSSSKENSLGKVTTDKAGLAKAFINPSLKEKWEAAGQHIFIVKEGDEEVISDFSITKARVQIDTSSADGFKSITVTIKKQEKGEWAPAADVEMRIGVKRLGGILSAGDDATYTTDSTGIVSVEFKKDSLPGDEKGNIILAAKIEDNEFFGNLQEEKVVHWGKAQKADHSFYEKRTLWTTRFRTPYWLLIIATTVIVSVWGTLLYLIFQLFKIRKLGSA
jgi:hypothetical protein